MIIDAGHIRWIAGTGLAAVASSILYVWADRTTPGGLRGGTTAGLWFGIAGTLLMAFAGALSALRKVPAWWWIGSRKAWLKGHIWLGLLSVLLILCHSGFRFGGPLERVLWVVFATIVISGIVGLLLQQSLPGLLARRVHGEVSFEQLPHYCGVLRGRADDLCDALKLAISPADDAAGRFYSAYDDDVRPFFDVPAPRRTTFIDEHAIRVWFDRVGEALRIGAAGDAEAAAALVNDLRPTIDPAKAKELLPRLDKLVSGMDRLFDTVNTAGLPAAAQASFTELRTLATGAPEVVPAVISQAASAWMAAIESLVTERSGLRFQERVHRWLHGWLLIHVPLSAALLALTLAHIVMSLYY
ncbi:MAG: hypothetical protein K1X57_09585 [Gemmataceae bacterium]|nr:hypothetical protein [Gemmataceae bacterium]